MFDQDNFVLIKGYTDFGTEVEYLYNPKSGEAGTWDLGQNGHMAGRLAIAGPSFRVRGQGSAEILIVI